MTDTKQHDSTRFVQEKHLEAMKLRFLGRKYSDIAEELELCEDTVKNWFRKGSRLYIYYQYFCDEITRELREKLINNVVSSGGEAFDTLIDLMKNSKNEQVRLRASTYLLDKVIPYAFDQRSKEEFLQDEITRISLLYDVDPKDLTEANKDFVRTVDVMNKVRAGV